MRASSATPARTAAVSQSECGGTPQVVASTARVSVSARFPTPPRSARLAEPDPLAEQRRIPAGGSVGVEQAGADGGQRVTSVLSVTR